MTISGRRADMFTADGNPSEDDPREHLPHLGDERQTLLTAIQQWRLTLELKCAGLDAEQMARRSVEPSTLSLLGLVRHLAEVERNTFRVLLGSENAPKFYCSPANPDGDFDDATADPAKVEEAWATWRAEVAHSDEVVARYADLGLTAGDPENKHGSGGGDISVREILAGMIGEYARHMGHADLLRERIDGRIGQ